MNPLRFHGFTGVGLVSGMFFVTSCLAFAVMIGGVWMLLDYGERSVIDELVLQREFVQNTIGQETAKFCKSGRRARTFDLEKMGIVQYLNFDNAAAVKALRNPPEQLQLSPVLVGSAKEPSDSTKGGSSCPGKGTFWQVVKGQPNLDRFPEEVSWRKGGFYTLFGVLEFNARAERQRWRLVVVPVSRSISWGPRQIALLGAASLFAVFLIVYWYLVFKLAVPVRYLELALDHFHGAIVRRKNESPASWLARIRRVSEVEEVGAARARAAIRAFNFLHEELGRFLDFQSRMMAGLSHDLRSYLNSLRVTMKTVDWSSSERDSALRLIRGMEITVNDTLYQLSGKGMEEEFATVDLGATLRALASDMEKKFGKIEVEESSERIVVQARPEALYRALGNLVGNAKIHGGSAELRIRASGTLAAVEIADRGPGMPKGKDVMEPFVRGDPSRNIRTGGSGLGLTIARDVIQSCDGKLEHLDREGGGTVARVTFRIVS